MKIIAIVIIQVFVGSACRITQYERKVEVERRLTVNSVVKPRVNIETSEKPSALDKCVADFSNYTFDWFPAEYSALVKDKKVSLINGKSGTRPTSKEHLMFEASLENVSCVLVAGEQDQIAIVTVGVSFSNRAKPLRIFVFKVENGKVRTLWKYDTGTEYRDLRELSFEKRGNLVIEEYDNRYGNPTPSQCCPQRIIRTSFSYRANTFERTHVEYVPYSKDYREFLGYRINPSDNM